MLVMNWILNSMEESIAASFKYCDTAKELWDSIEAAYEQKRNNARIFELKMEIALIQQGEMAIGNCYAKFRCLLRRLALYMSSKTCCKFAKEQGKLLEDP